MNDPRTSQGTGSTVADAAERIASLLGPADSETDEAQGETPEDDTDDLEAEAEGEDGEVEESDEQDETDDAEEQPDLYTVKVAGEEVKVTLDEALRGYSREQDYIRKTSAHAAQVKADAAETAGLRDEYRTRLETVSQLIEASQPKVDQSLRDTDPAEWSAQMHQHRQWVEQRQAVAAEKARLAAEAESQTVEARNTFVRQEQEKLTKLIPEWSDPKVAEAESARLYAFGIEQGYDPSDMDEVVDSRAVKILRDAMLYRELVSKSAKVKATVKATAVAKPGAATAAPSRVTGLNRAKQRLRQSGRVEDAQAAIERMLG